MVSPLGASTLYGEPGQFSDLIVDDRFWFDSGSGSYNGAGTSTEFVMPSFDFGEVWAIKIRLTLSSEPTDDIVVLELMDEDETNYIQKATVPEFGGNEAEINTIVDWEAAAYDSAAGSPDTRVTVVGSDTGNYFIDVVGVQLRRPTDTSAHTPDVYNLQGWDDTTIQT